MASQFTAAQLDRLAGLATTIALAELRDTGQLEAAAVALARAALAAAEAQPQAAEAWLALAQAVLAVTGEDPAAAAWTAYAQARLATLAGDLAGAEARLHYARTQWEQAGEPVMVARSGLGLTQVLTVQGRYGEAEVVIRATIAQLDDLGAAAAMQAAAARQNLATLLSYQERHAAALVESSAARVAVAAELAAAPAEERDDLTARLARIDMTIALAQTHLDDPAAAERTLRSILAALLVTADPLDRGRAGVNLGYLLTRTGRYAEALAVLDQAMRDLLGTDDPDSATAAWPRADVLFLEQARVYLALNLLPEADASLRRAVTLFRTTGQRYELGQALLNAGLLAAAQGDLAGASTLLDEAAAIYAALDNRYWLHQIDLAQVGLALRRGDVDDAARRVNVLLQALSADGAANATHWDRLGRGELHLLAAEVSLAQQDPIACAARLAAASAALGVTDAAVPPELPAAHLHLRLLHLSGRRLRMLGDNAAARTVLAQAVDRLEAQRTTFALEELRSAYLTDKLGIYADLVLAWLDAQAGEQGVAAAFAVVERARSRALLERLLAATSAAAAGAADEQTAMLRQQLHWLYNRWLGESGSRGGSVNLVDAIRTHEAALEQRARRSSAWLADVEPVDLAALQGILAADQQAVVYFTAGDEVLAFVVDAARADVVRDLCSTGDLADALSELSFQMGRSEVGGAHAPWREARLRQATQRALHRLHRLVFAPLSATLHATRLLIIPHGELHLAPFAALWDGQHYLLERHEIAYAPSASVVVHHAAGADAPQTMLAALALEDAAIPKALPEVQAAARHFASARLFLGAAATEDGLRQAAALGDILHVATHGLFRSDNPFFSALKLADCWMDVRSIYNLPLHAHTVVLSACESGAVRVQGAGEAVGLARGFLGAGARTLVVSLWNVHDASAADLMNRFYATLTAAAGRRAPAALRAAQLAAVQAGDHPYYWAPYIAIDTVQAAP